MAICSRRFKSLVLKLVLQPQVLQLKMLVVQLETASQISLALLRRETMGHLLFVDLTVDNTVSIHKHKRGVCVCVGGGGGWVGVTTNWVKNWIMSFLFPNVFAKMRKISIFRNISVKFLFGMKHEGFVPILFYFCVSTMIGTCIRV